ncbi:IS4 family transposase [Nocardia sp. NBC_01730]|uniref:IS4 family transposase n=1 Tax=Nocardia sp. NBC_01730 TaxID=2975998 RepID=UPI002E120209|nr:IS4 family transposase [Nocardia sp. NBC_01730]
MPSQSVTTTLTRTITVAGGIFAPGHLGELTQYLPFELIDDVLARTRAVQRRTRLLPSRVGVYFVLALAVFPSLGYERVWDKLIAGLGSLLPHRPSEKGLRDLRRRVGAAPLKALFEVVAGPLAQPATPGVCYRRWRTVAFDGCGSLQAPDQPRIRLWLGKFTRYRGGTEGYPHLRVLTLCETGTRGLLGAVFGSIRRSETDYAATLVPLLNGTMLLLADRNFGGDDILTRVAATGAQLVVRLTSRRRPAVWATLPDGSVLTRINGHRFRIIDTQITATCADGSRVGDRYRIITTLLDHRTDPAIQIARLYHERWEIESAFFALRHTLFHGRVLRSTDPVGLEQEMWAMLTIYQTLRRAICDAVETVPGTDPDRASFTVALTAAINQIVTAANITGNVSPENAITRAVLDNLLPARRPRISARKVKCPMSRYGTALTGNRPTKSQTVVRVELSALVGPQHTKTSAQPSSASDPGRRHQVLQLLRTDPDRSWTPSEIAQALKIARYRSLCGQMCQWTSQGFLDRIGRGLYRLNHQWLAPDQPPTDIDSTDGLNP